MRARDDFAGAGGWDVAAHVLGLDVLGLEIDEAACATRAAAGFATLRADIAALDPREFAAPFQMGSPPCPSFSNGGKRLGALDMPMIKAVMDGFARDEDLRGAASWHDARSALTVEPLRWALAARPEIVCLEQVPAVMPLWEHMAEILRSRGYGVWTGLLRAEQFGVPQTRTRAFLIARADGKVCVPAPTNSRYYERDPARLDLGVDPWVSMAESLGWATADRVGFPRRADTDDVVTLAGIDYRARDLRRGDQPAFGITEKIRSWSRFVGDDVERVTPEEAAALQTFPRGTAVIDTGNTRSGTREFGRVRGIDHPAPTLTSRAHQMEWASVRPATTVQGDPRLWPPGHKENRHDPPGKYQQRRGDRAYRMQPWEAACLQAFPDGFPFQGTRTQVFQQIGNAVPPLLAYHVLATALDGA
jgi:DNA (cytosine-5)-methyltransferase 1